VYITGKLVVTCQTSDLLIVLMFSLSVCVSLCVTGRCCSDASVSSQSADQPSSSSAHRRRILPSPVSNNLCCFARYSCLMFDFTATVTTEIFAEHCQFSVIDMRSSDLRFRFQKGQDVCCIRPQCGSISHPL